MTKKQNNLTASTFEILLNKYLHKLPKTGDTILGKIISCSKNEILVDIPGFNIGIARGQELADINTDLEYRKIEPGSDIEATILDLGNEKGQIELSLRSSKEQIWDKIAKDKEQKKIIEAMILGANKGGLLTKIYNISAFLPVSQLASRHYPKVEGGDKMKILKRLKKLIGKKCQVQIMSIEREQDKQDKIIISEKMLEQEEQKKKLKNYKIGEVIEGTIIRFFDFGALIQFDKNLEGLAHISEITWQPIKKPEEVLKIGDTVKAEIINIRDTQVFLSLKRLEANPFEKEIQEFQLQKGKYVQGKINSILPYGLLVQITPNIQGLAFISDIDVPTDANIFNAYKIGEEKEFKILKIDFNRGKVALGNKEDKEEKNKEPILNNTKQNEEVS